MRPHALKSLLLLAALLLAAPLPVRAVETVVYGFHENFPPFSFMKEGRPTGFELELLDAALQGTQYRLQLRPMAWENILISLNNRGVHLASGMARTPQREQAYIFTSRPSVVLQTRIFQNTRAGIQSLEQLRGDPAAVRRDSLYQYDLERLNIFDIQLFNSQNAAMEALWSGRVQAMCTADKIGYYLIETGNYSGISATGASLRQTALYYALRRDQTALRDAIDKGIERLQRSGAYERIYSKWFVPELDRRQILKLVQAAKEGADKSYVPYSLKAQGGAVLTRSGRHYAGGRIENGDPRLTRSGLTVAIQQAASRGDTDILAAVSTGPDGKALPPTADERRLLYQFGRGVMAVMEPEAGDYSLRLITDLLPDPERIPPWQEERRGF